MALNLGELYFQLGARTEGLNRAERHARRFSRKTQKEFNATSTAAKRLGAAIAGIVSAEGLRRLTMFADSYVMLHERIKTATRSTGDYIHVQDQLLKISTKIGTPFRANVGLFQALARIAPDIGATTRDILKLVKAVGQMGVISGADPTHMKHGLLQLAQGMSTVIFRAEEMNSLLENLPEVTNAMAKGLGMTPGEMRNAVVKGEIMSKDAYKALLSQADVTDEIFNKIQLTVARGVNASMTGLADFVGQMDKAFGLTSGLARKLQALGEYLLNDFTKQINAAKGVFGKIGDSISQWVILFDAVGIKLGSLVMIAKDALKLIYSFAKYTGSTLLDLPVNLLTIYKLTIEWIGKLLGAGKAIGSSLSVMFKKLWANVKFYAFSAIIGISVYFEKVFNRLFNYASKFLNKMLNAAKRIPGLSQIIGDFEIPNFELDTTSQDLAFGKFKKAHDEKIKMYDDEADEIKKLFAMNNHSADKNIQNVFKVRDATRIAIEDTEFARARALEDERQGRLRYVKEMEGLLDQQYMEQLKSGQDREAENEAKKAAKEQAAANEKLKNKLSPKINTLQEGLLSERELAEKHYKESLELLDQAERLKIETIKPYNQLREQLAEQHKQKLLDIEAEARDALIDKYAANFSTIQESLMTERELEQQHYEQALEALIAAEQLQIDTIIPYYELKERLKMEHEQRMADYDKKAAAEKGKTAAINAFLGVDIQEKADDMSDAQQAKRFKNQIDIAAQHSKKFFELKKALALATALIEAPATILSAYNFGVTLGGGPPLGTAMAAIAAAAVAVQIKAIASAQYQGRAGGGSVMSGGMYRVNERGPEMLSVGSKDYLMMGNQSGNVTPNHKLGGRTENKVIVNVHPLAGETANVESNETENGTEINIMIEQIEQNIADGIGRGGSSVSDAIEHQYGLNRAAGGV